MTVNTPLNIILVLFLFAAAGCGEKDCASMADLNERDWCFHELTVKHAKADQLEPALAAVTQIQAPMVRAFAIQELMVAGPKGMSKERAEALCRTLQDNQIESCLRTWSRPHLWNN